MSLLATAGFEIFSSCDVASPLTPTRPYLVNNFDPLQSPNTKHKACQTPKTSPRNKSYSPTSAEVCVLPSDLVCVGLSDELGADHWGLKIIKLVAFPELITRPSRPSVPSVPIPYTQKYQTLLFKSPPNPDPLARKSSPTSSDSSFSSGDDSDDGYWSHSPETTESHSSNLSHVSRCHSDIFSPRLSKQILSSGSKPRTLNVTNQLHPPPNSGSKVPFLSYTRTSEGLSLTTDVYVLSTLVPPSERHMVNSSGELDDADSRSMNGSAGDVFQNEEVHQNILSCLQINLQRFGLGI